MPQMLMPIFTEQVKLITSTVGYAKRDGKIFYFNGEMPLFMHDEKDEDSFKMFMAQLYVVGNVPQAAINRAFGLNAINMKRWVKKYNDGGPAVFYKKERKRRATIMTEEILNKAQALLDEGIPRKEIADKLRLKITTLKTAIQTGKLRSRINDSLKKKTRHLPKVNVVSNTDNPRLDMPVRE